MKVSFLIFFILFLSGCSTPYQSKNIYKISAIEKRDMDESNRTYAHEPWAKENKRPLLGIALSGGGSKAAPFAMGVLKRFVDEGWMKNVDIISSVSGGSYSAYYFYSRAINSYESNSSNSNYRKFFKSCNIDDCYDEQEGAYQKYLKEYQDIFLSKKSEVSWSDSHKDEMSSLGIVIEGFWDSCITSYLHHTANTLFDWKVELSPLQYRYMEGIIRTYGILPSEFSEQYGLEEYYNKKYRQRFSSLAPLVKDKLVPLWIINSSNFEEGWYKELKGKGYSNLDNSIFEFTPLGFGSGRYGYVVGTPDKLGIDLPRAVLASSAFLDGTSSRTGQEVLLGLSHLFNLRWGIKIPNYATTIKRQYLHNFLPFPFYYFDMNSSKITLADGGQSGDNLGIYSLIKRGTQNIVVVSGAYDLKVMDSSKKLKLKNMCAVSRFLKSKHLTVKFTDDKNAENSLNFIDKFCQEDSSNKIAFDNWKNPVWKGEVVNDKGKTVSKLFFIKAAIDRKSVDTYPQYLKKFLLEPKYKHEFKSFPQTTTMITTLNSSQNLYQAYMALGFYLSGYLNEKEFLTEK